MRRYSHRQSKTFTAGLGKPFIKSALLKKKNWKNANESRISMFLLYFENLVLAFSDKTFSDIFFLTTIPKG